MSPRQQDWARLCAYLAACVRAEANATFIDLPEIAKRLTDVNGWSALVDSAEVVLSGPVAEHLNASRRRQQRAGASQVILGWPIVVPRARGNQPLRGAPLLLASGVLDVDRSTGQWRFSRATEVELNAALLAEQSAFEAARVEVEQLLASDIEALSHPAIAGRLAQVADVLGLPASRLGDASPSTSVPRGAGLFNCSVVLTDSPDLITGAIATELEELGSRTDWQQTAAAALLTAFPPPPPPQGNSSLRKPVVCLPLPSSDRMETILERVQTQPLTVVEGPPGTGKSQLVVMAAANEWMNGRTTLLTSTNNKAVDVAVQRARSVHPGLMIRTGSQSHRDSLNSLLTEVVQAATSETGSRAPEVAARVFAGHSRVRQTTRALAATIRDGEILATPLAEVAAQCEQALWEAGRFGNLAERRDTAAPLHRAFRSPVFTGLRVWLAARKLGLRTKPRLVAKDPEQLGALQTWATAITDLVRHTEAVARAEAELANGREATFLMAEEAFQAASLTAVTDTLSRHIAKNQGLLSSLASAGRGRAFVAALTESTRVLRSWACTALSVPRSFRMEPGIFDLAIIDEASQCHAAYVLPIAYRARRLLVVGDSRQLTPVVKLTSGSEEELRRRHHASPLITANYGLSHLEGSAFRAFQRVLPDATAESLLEHYRCHPHIARWFNRTFYGETLRVLTDTSHLETDETALIWLDVDGRCQRPQGRASSWVNPAEVDEALRQIELLLEQDLSIGVVSPFAGQADLIEDQAIRRFTKERLAEKDFVCGSAHRLQGDERDAIIFSSCIADGITSRSARWVEENRNLINVAVSRARRRLIVLGSPRIADFGVPTLSDLRSFTITQESAPFSAPLFDSTAEEYLYNQLIDDGLQPLAKLHLAGYELDIALRTPLVQLDVEIDGKHHEEESQFRNDLIRDKIVRKHRWTVFRVPAWRCYLEPVLVSREIRQLLEAASTS